MSYQVLDDGHGEDCSPPEPGKRWLTIADANGEEIAVIVNRKGEPTPEQYETAHLLAAAPDLFASLERLTRVANQKEPDPLAMFVCIEQARAVLAKAKPNYNANLDH